MSAVQQLITRSAFAFSKGAPAVLAFLASLSTAAPALAQTAPTVVNGDFEANSIASYTQFKDSQSAVLGDGRNQTTGWTVTGQYMFLSGSMWAAQNGSNSIGLQALNPGAATFASIKQSITGLMTGWTYSLDFWLSGSPAQADLYGSVKRATAFFTQTVGAGTETISNIYEYNITTQANTNANMKYVKRGLQFTYSGTSGSGEIGFSSLANLGGSSGDAGPVIDNVSISIVATPGPEAGAGLSMLAGMIGLALWRRRQAKATA